MLIFGLRKHLAFFTKEKGPTTNYMNYKDNNNDQASL